MAEADVIAKLDALAKDVRKILLDFDQLRNEVRDIPPKIEDMNKQIATLNETTKGAS